MSALFGVVGDDDRDRVRLRLRAMDGALAAYGPDRSSVQESAGAGLGWRLMRFTPEDAHEAQPIHREGVVLVSIGRVDNRPELAAALALQHRPELPDSEFLVAAWRRWGHALGRHVVGAYTVAIGEETARRLCIARSAFGGPALYYHRLGAALIFSTRPRGLFALRDVRRAPNLERVADFLAAGPNPPGRTFYHDVHVLPAGWSLTFEHGTLSLQEDWSPIAAPDVRVASRGEYVEAFTSLFDRVVSDHLRSASGVAIMMSGGLDSSSLGATAAHLAARRDQRVVTFTQTPAAGVTRSLLADRYGDESPFVAAIAARHPNLEATFVPETLAFALDGIHTWFGASEYPFRNLTNRPWWERIQALAAERRTRVLLTGLAGNFTLSWDGRTRIAELLGAGRLAEAWRQAAMLGRTGSQSRWTALFGNGGLLNLMPDPVWRGATRLRRMPGRPGGRRWRRDMCLRPELAAEQRLDERWRARGDALHFRPRRTYREALHWGLQHAALMSDIDQGYKELYGIDARHPLADIRLAAFCAGLPSDQFRDQGESRLLARRSMQDRLPPEVLRNRRRGIQAANWYAALYAHRDQVRLELDAIAASPLASHVLDVASLRALEAAMPPPDRTRAETTSLSYRSMLCVALMTGSFLRWIEASAG